MVKCHKRKIWVVKNTRGLIYIRGFEKASSVNTLKLQNEEPEAEGGPIYDYRKSHHLPAHPSFQVIFIEDSSGGLQRMAAAQRWGEEG